GTMGELMTSAFLSVCVGARAGTEAARGWGGDTYTLATNAEGASALLWISAWDDAASAERFASALQSCKRVRPAPFTTRREGTHVSYVEGLDEDARGTLARRMSTFVGEPPPPRPPHSDVHVPPMPSTPEEFRHAGQITPDGYRNASLGIRADLAPLTVDADA